MRNRRPPFARGRCIGILQPAAQVLLLPSSKYATSLSIRPSEPGRMPASEDAEDSRAWLLCSRKQSSKVSSRCMCSAPILVTHLASPSRVTCWSPKMILPRPSVAKVMVGGEIFMEKTPRFLNNLAWTLKLFTVQSNSRSIHRTRN